MCKWLYFSKLQREESFQQLSDFSEMRIARCAILYSFSADWLTKGYILHTLWLSVQFPVALGGESNKVAIMHYAMRMRAPRKSRNEVVAVYY